jgi:hypothetical protein
MVSGPIPQTYDKSETSILTCAFVWIGNNYRFVVVFLVEDKSIFFEDYANEIYDEELNPVSAPDTLRGGEGSGQLWREAAEGGAA